MTIEKIHFDVALSYSEEDAWAAKDIHDLILERGFSVYCSDRQPDLARGVLRERLYDIYANSRVNVMIWSSSYASKPMDSIVAMEQQWLWSRHVKQHQEESLFILALDDTPLPPYLAGILTHKLRKIGLYGAMKAILARLKQLSTYSTEFGMVSHPIGTEKDRGQLHPCFFSIKPDYQSSDRWERLADIEVEIMKEKFRPGLHIYLIPSGGATPLLRHSVLLRTDPGLLEYKRRVSIKFAQERIGQKLNGFWFFMRKGEVDIPTVYSAEYDAFLNTSMQGYLIEQRRKDQQS